MRSSICAFLAVVGVAAFVGSPDSLWSQTSPVSVIATFDKDYFDSAEPMGVTITAVNTTGKYLLVNKGFSSKLFHLEMRLIDPAGRLLLPKCDQPRTEFPDAPPLGFVLCDGVPTRIAPYEVLPPDWSVTQRTDDLRDCYTIKLSGHYSAQVQLSVMVFRESNIEPIVDPCYGDIKNYESLEVVKSEPQTLYKQGSTEVNVIPKYWLRAWQDGLHLIPDIAVTIWPGEGRVADDYSCLLYTSPSPRDTR